MKTKLLFVGLLALMLISCGGKQSNLPVGMTEEEYTTYQNVLSSINTIEQEYNGITTMSSQDAIHIIDLCNQLVYNYDPMGKDSTTLSACEQLKVRIDTLRSRLLTKVNELLPSILVDVVNNSDILLEKTETYPVYLQRGDTLHIDIKAERTCTFKVYNADAKSCLLTRTGKSLYSEKLGIKNTAIYLIEVNPGKAQYAALRISYSACNIERLKNPIQVHEEQVEAKSGDWRCTSVKGIKMKNLFEEPRKFTLRGQIKATFSGSYRALVAVQVPSGATDILYSLRISTNEGSRYSDGEFHDNMELSYKRIKMLGLPIYESHKGGSIIATILGENQPPREEDAYINMYVFYSASQAKKFQDGTAASKLQYNVDYSTLGTQSCNGRIPSKGYKTIYLAFENERMRYNNYVWLEAVSAVPTTEYFKTKYTIE